MQLSGLELQQATQGKWHYQTPDMVKIIQTDSRYFQHGDSFLALRGPHFDGHKFAQQLTYQAQALIGDHQGINTWKSLSIPKLEVQDTLQALGDIAHAWRQHLKKTQVIAITGSYGKTTVRSMLSHVFQALNFKTQSTHANLNNLIGVPMTLLNIAQDTDIALIECGISEKGEMSRLADIVQADIAIITGISQAHSEGLGGLAGVIQEKSALLEHLSPHGWCAFGAGAKKHLNQKSLNVSNALDSYVGWHMQGCSLNLEYQGTKASLELALPAQHWGENMALVATIVLKFCQNTTISIEQIAGILNSWQAPQGRMQTHIGINNSCILNDCYNANPVSMQAALQTLLALDKHSIAILGDMAELGDEAHDAHTHLDVSHIDQLILTGKHMQALHKKHPKSLWFKETNQLVSWVSAHKSTFKHSDAILVKGSRSMHLEQVVNTLKEQGETYVV